MASTVKSLPPAPQAEALQHRNCKGCGLALERGEDAPLYCSPRCRALVWRRSRRRVGLGPRQRG